MSASSRNLTWNKKCFKRTIFYPNTGRYFMAMTPTMDRATGTVRAAGMVESRPAWRAYQVLHFGFAAAPILAGIDKYSDVLTNWSQYLAPVVPRVTGLTAPGFMKIVGVIEVVAGIGVIVK